MPALAQRQLRLDFLLAQEAVRTAAAEADVGFLRLADTSALKARLVPKASRPRQPRRSAIIENREERTYSWGSHSG